MYKAKVELLNSASNIATGDVITTFLIHNVPATVQAELLTHGLLSVNSESSRARPVNAVADQVRYDPYLPSWTKDQKGMSGQPVSPVTGYLADQLATNHRNNCLRFASDLQDLGIHKQDANKLALSPFVVSNVIVTATHWDNFLALRLAEDAHPAMRSIAGEIQKLLAYPPENRFAIDTGFYTPYPDLTMVEAVAKVASVSYANHAKDRSPEGADRLVSSLAANRHASPFCMAARQVIPGGCLDYTRRDGTKKRYIIFDNFAKEESACHYADHVTESADKGIPLRELLDTDNFAGWVSLRRLEGL